MKDSILVALLVAILFILLLVVIVSRTDQPDVYISWSSKECVKVKHSKVHDCDNLPKKYNTVWVQ